eukprot:CAMPEP_0181361798 /NCGR_PEP_ID=MMETSP1106-20121128/7562_1 /TAXON_ID=81844 /ORGANISM="Mantoniella antarctica, Strain SL-175" /LENGTH=151 /DNA_ID=CAMNT_0023475503 /DNA_START=30 /DNA_END=485 /DNA_ORIENTATION=+
MAASASRASPDFKLWNQLGAGKFEVLNLPLCKVLLNNDTTWPWLVLVPQQNDLVEMHDLSDVDQLQLMREMSACSRAVQSGWAPTKVNVGAIGCVCRQLHVHVLGRFEGDAVWPQPVWGATKAVPYPTDGVQRDADIAKFREEIGKFIVPC